MSTSNLTLTVVLTSDDVATLVDGVEQIERPKVVFREADLDGMREEALGVRINALNGVVAILKRQGWWESVVDFRRRGG